MLPWLQIRTYNDRNGRLVILLRPWSPVGPRFHLECHQGFKDDEPTSYRAIQVPLTHVSSCLILSPPFFLSKCDFSRVELQNHNGHCPEDNFLQSMASVQESPLPRSRAAPLQDSDSAPGIYWPMKFDLEGTMLLPFNHAVNANQEESLQRGSGTKSGQACRCQKRNRSASY